MTPENMSCDPVASKYFMPASAGQIRGTGERRPDPGLDVTIHFHPDTPANGSTLLDFLATDGLYRSQFGTGAPV